MAHMHYVGLDVHRNRTSMEVLDPDGKWIVRKEIVGDWDAVVRAVKALPRPLAVCYEASCGYGYLHERLGKVADRIEVAHPGQLRLIFRSKKKSDRVDASKIAKLLYLDAIPQVHVPNLDVRGGGPQTVGGDAGDDEERPVLAGVTAGPRNTV